LAVLKNLAHYDFASKDQKVMSFTDNRQDAALQAGHFNDFMSIIRIRSAINSALEVNQELDFTNISQEVFIALNLGSAGIHCNERAEGNFVDTSAKYVFANLADLVRFPTVVKIARFVIS